LRFDFIRQQKKAYPVTLLCKVMNVSRSGFYDHVQSHDNSPGDRVGDPVLKARIKAIFKLSRSSYGSRRVLSQLRSEGYRIGRYKVRRLMRDLGLKAKVRRRFKVTTESRHSFPVAPNILERHFDVKQPNKVWTADISYVWTLEGWLYLAVVMDLFSRQIVGWAMDKRIKKQLTLNALAMAYWRRKPLPGLLHHSDRGSQYACHDYQNRLGHYGMIASMSRKGDCWDNAPTERFFRSLKTERLDGIRFPSRASAKLEIVDYITYYNSLRLHSTLGYVSPMGYEKELLRKAA
jgi:transposase InsO family protein